MKLCKALRKLEIKANKAADDLCNVPDYQRKANAIFKTVADAVCMLLKKGPALHVNRDPRGYALKISDHWMHAHPECHLHRDMGGFGILAPEID